MHPEEAGVQEQVVQRDAVQAAPRPGLVFVLDLAADHRHGGLGDRRVEKVWFDEAVTCRSRAEIGIPATPDESFILHDDDTIASVQQAHREACESSRRATSSLGLDDRVYGYWRGPLPLRWVYLHVLRELAQHCGHADILREQILNG